ncbi:MlaD family protein [Burkholderia sp. L27(2015)]|uniref:MlaD family protein n=1 Tax=Burkholderia sp. L27(2015) TaxID=1641858 RepID=UPI00131AB7F6|nr:MlaD family protein [Burkholderia sp. L27(2015)]
MENKSHAFWAGLFTISLGLAVVLILFWFNRDHSERVPYDLIATTNVTGLANDASVRYRGLGVGRVESIKFDPTNAGQIIIRVMVNRGTPVTHSTYGSLSFQGVTGIAFVQLDDTGDDKRPLATSPKNVARLPLNPGLLEQLQKRGEVLLREMELVAQHVDKLTDEQTRDQLLAMAKSIQVTADAARPALEQLPHTIDKLDRTLDSTTQLMIAMGKDNGPLVRNLNKVGQAADDINRAVQTVSDRVADDTLPRLNALSDDVRAATRSFNRATDSLGSNPRSFLFGNPTPEPGPGETGFKWPNSRSSAQP